MKNSASVCCLFLFSFLFLVPIPVVAKVWINEFSSDGSNDWIELYNDADGQVTLDDYRIRDGSSSNKVDLTGVIEGKGFSVFDWGSKLNNSGDTIRLLLKSDETIIDEMTYGGSGVVSAPEEGQTAGRQTNGDSSWVLFSVASKGSSNVSSAIAPTATDIPKNTPTPTKEPTPTKIPSPTKVLTKVIDDEYEDTTANTAAANTKTTKKTPTESIFRISGVPTSILGISTNSAAPKPTKKLVTKPTPKILVKDAVSVQPIPLIAGSVFLIACGILVFLKQRHKRYE